MSTDLIIWEWFRDKKTGMKHRRLGIPGDAKKKNRLIDLLVDALGRLTGAAVNLEEYLEVDLSAPSKRRKKK